MGEAFAFYCWARGQGFKHAGAGWGCMGCRLEWQELQSYLPVRDTCRR